MSLLATLIIGGFTSVGSCTILGFMKAFPPDSVSGISSGTGLAGISGAGLYLLFSSLGLSFNIVVLILMPVALLYAANFRFILNLKANIEQSIRDRLQGAQAAVEAGTQQLADQETAEAKEAQMNEPLSVETIKNVLKLVGWPLFNLSAVRSLNLGLLPRVCLHYQLC